MPNCQDTSKISCLSKTAIPRPPRSQIPWKPGPKKPDTVEARSQEARYRGSQAPKKPDTVEARSQEARYRGSLIPIANK